jgi:hypothetical protein
MKVVYRNNKPKTKLQVFLHWAETTAPTNYPLVGLAIVGAILSIYIVYWLIIMAIVGMLSLIW